MNVEIDQNGCIECGACEEVCPDVFKLEDGEKASIVDKYQADSPSVGEVSDNLDDCVKKASDECPVDVINYD